MCDAAITMTAASTDAPFREHAFFQPMPTGPNAGFITLVEEIAALHKFRQDAIAFGTYSEVDDFVETAQVFAFLEQLHADASYLELLESNAPGCQSTDEVFDFVYDCVSQLRERQTDRKAAH